MKIYVIPLILVSALCAGCPSNPTTPEIESTLGPVWRVGLVDCAIKRDEREAALIGALITFGVNFGVSLLRGAMAKAGDDKTETANSYHADYLLHGNTTRACVIIGWGKPRTDSQQELASTFIGKTLWATGLQMDDPNISNKMHEDAYQLGFEGKPKFLVRFVYSSSTDFSAVKPNLRYLYYPEHLVDRDKDQMLVITVDGKVPGETKTSTLALSATIPSVSSDDNKIYERANLQNLQLINGWVNLPKAWSQTCSDPSDQNTCTRTGSSGNVTDYAMPINLSGQIVATASGSKFWKTVSGNISDTSASALATAIASEINKDTEEISNGTVQTYLDAIAGYKTQLTAKAKLCADKGSDAAVAAADATIQAARFKAITALDKVPGSIRSDAKYRLPDMPDLPPTGCPD